MLASVDCPFSFQFRLFLTFCMTVFDFTLHFGVLWYEILALLKTFSFTKHSASLARNSHLAHFCGLSLNVSLVSNSVLFWCALLVCYSKANLNCVVFHIIVYSSVLKTFTMLILVCLTNRSLGCVPWISYTNWKTLCSFFISVTLPIHFSCKGVGDASLLPLISAGQGYWQGPTLRSS